MKLQTPIDIPPGEPKIGYGSGLVCLGSCFAGHMAQKFDYYQFRQLGNPFGVIFHPLPLADLLERALQHKPIEQDELFFDGRQWAYYGAHGALARPKPEETLTALNGALRTLTDALGQASHLILSFGSAWGYLMDERVVANCHKMPAATFSKELTPVEALAFRYQQLIAALYRFNPQLQLILTVSPVRHIKDGLVQNMRSKARLIELVHNLEDWYRNVHYFPAYELLMDELRDYRFYQEDMIHPSPQAVDHIWEQFAAAWIDPSTDPLRQRIANIRQRQAHRPLFPDSPEHRAFTERLKADIEAIQTEFPHIQLAE